MEVVRVPVDLYGRLLLEASRRGQPVGVVAGDLVAEVLPGALAEEAWKALRVGREVLARVEREAPTGLPSGGDP